MTWPMQRISELCLLAVDCVNKTAPVVDYETPYRMIRTTNVKSGFVDVDDVRYVSEETFEKWTRRSRPQFGDVILTREAPVGEVGRFTSMLDTVFLGQRLFHYRPDPARLDWNFLAYVLQSYNVQGRLRGMGFGATVEHIKVGDAENLLIPTPPVGVQRRIGDTLSAYDDLIENNRRRIALLEEAARQLYREWFVRLRFPGHEHTRITDGVPKGWDHKKVGDLLAKIPHKRKIQKGEYLEDGPIPCVDQSADFIGGYTDDEDAVYSTILPTIVFGDHTRTLKFVIFPFARGADGTQIIHSKTEQISNEYLYCALKEIDLSNYFYARHFKFLKEKTVLLPDAGLVRVFTAFAKPCFEQVHTLRQQIRKLHAARNVLLPRLMSGDFAV